MFKSRKITKLLESYARADTNKGIAQIISELRQMGKPAVRETIEALKQRKLGADKAQFLLYKLCDDSYAQDIVPLISDSYDEARRLAKDMITRRFRKSSLPILIENLKSEDFYSRINATEILTILKDPTCVPPLVSLFNNADAKIKSSIITILSGTGGETAKKLILSALNDDSWEVRLWAVKSLGKMRAPESVDQLIEMLSEEDPKVKKLALDALGAIGDKRAAPPMVQLLKDEDLLVRQKAAEYIIEIAEASIVPDIMNLMRDHDVNVRRCAVEVLNNLKDPRTSDELLNAIKDSDWWVRQIATSALTGLRGDNIVNGFMAMICEPDENIRRCAVEFFNKVPDKSSFESLIGLLKDEDWWVREKAVSALGKLRDKRAIAPLAEMIDDQEVKWRVPTALAEIGGDEVIKYIKEFLLDEQKQARKEAIKALGQLKGVDVVSDLKECLNDTEEEVRDEAVETLKKLTGKVYRAEKGQTSGQVPQVAVSRVNAPEGSILTEAILVLDLCDSTDMANRYGDNFAMNVMKTLTNTVTPIAQRERYQFMKNTGDGFLITFPSVVNSVRFALNVLGVISKKNAKADKVHRINLRFAINLGETRVDKRGDRLGAAVSMTFRVEGVRPEGLIPIEKGMSKEDMPLVNRILITEGAKKEIEKAKKLKIRLIGLFELKGLTGLHKLYDLSLVN